MLVENAGWPQKRKQGHQGEKRQQEKGEETAARGKERAAKKGLGHAPM